MAKLGDDSAETIAQLNAISEGNATALNQLLARHLPELQRYVNLRLDQSLRARVDPEDVIQETHVEVNRRISDYVSRRPMAFTVWLRRTAYESLLMIRRRECRTLRRSVARELPLPDGSSAALARSFLAPDSSVGTRLEKAEAAQLARLNGRNQPVGTQLMHESCLVPYGASWKYLDDGSDQGGAWRLVDFDDRHWKEREAQFLYGKGDEKTLVAVGGDAPHKYATTYLRHCFEATANAQGLQLGIVLNQGAAWEELHCSRSTSTSTSEFSIELRPKTPCHGHTVGDDKHSVSGAYRTRTRTATGDDLGCNMDRDGYRAVLRTSEVSASKIRDPTTTPLSLG